MHLTLRQKLAVLVFMVLLPLAGVIGYQLSHLARYLRAETLERTTDEAEFGAIALNSYVSQVAEQGRTIGKAVIVGEMSAEQSRRFLENVGTRNPDEEYAVYAPSGALIASSEETFAAAVSRLLSSGTGTLENDEVILASIDDVPTERGLVALTPVRVGGTTVAIAAAGIPESSIARALPRPSVTGGSLVTDSEGRVVHATPGLPIGARRLAGSLSTVAAALEGRPGVATRLKMSDSSDRYVGVQLPAGDLTVGFYTRSEGAYSQVYREAAFTGGIVLLVMVVAGLAAKQYAEGIVDVVKRLTDATHRVAGGDFGADVPIETTDEIGTLARDFSRMQESLRITFEDEALLSEAALSLNEATSIPAVAEASLTYLMRLVNASEAAMTVFAPDRSVRVFSQPVLASDFAERARRDLNDDALMGGPTIHEIPQGPKSCRVLSMPLRHAGDLLGRLDVALRRDEPNEAEQAETNLITSLARQASTALENVILFEREQLIAETLQDSLITALPQTAPLSIGLQYRPATVGVRVGGDFYDFLPLPLERFVVLVGDIAGKGLSAARQTAVSKGALRALALDDPSPQRVSERANRAMLSQLESDSFLTAFYSVIDVAHSRMVYATAGHPAPLLLHADGDIEVLQLSGPPLGVIEEAIYPEHRASFEPGATLVMYSDGISEARNEAGRMFGEARVRASLLAAGGCVAEDIALKIVEAAEDYAGQKLTDDLTVVVVHFDVVPQGLEPNEVGTFTI